MSQEQDEWAVRESSSASYPWKQIIARAVWFFGGILAGTLFWMTVTVFFRFTVIEILNPGNNTLGGGSPLFSILVGCVPLAAVFGGVGLANWIEKKQRFGSFRLSLIAILAAQKILILCAVIQLFALFFRGSGFQLLCWLSCSGAVFLVTHALGFRKKEQIVWIAVIGLSGLFQWIRIALGESARFETALPVATTFALLLGLVLMCFLSKRVSEILKAEGFQIGLLGAPWRSLPAGISSDHFAAISDRNETSNKSAGNESTTRNLLPFYYVGPNNESIGPIAMEVLFQLRGSGAVDENTLIAEEGEDKWTPMHSHSRLTGTEASLPVPTPDVESATQDPSTSNAGKWVVVGVTAIAVLTVVALLFGFSNGGSNSIQRSDSSEQQGNKGGSREVAEGFLKAMQFYASNEIPVRVSSDGVYPAVSEYHAAGEQGLPTLEFIQSRFSDDQLNRMMEREAAYAKEFGDVQLILRRAEYNLRTAQSGSSPYGNDPFVGASPNESYAQAKEQTKRERVARAQQEYSQALALVQNFASNYVKLE